MRQSCAKAYASLDMVIVRLKHRFRWMPHPRTCWVVKRFVFVLRSIANGSRQGLRMNIKKILYLILGCLGLGLGAVGAVVPLLPSVPFLLVAAFCFARSSERLNTWFTHTKLYQDNLADYVAHRGMTRKTKIRIMSVVTLLMGIAAVLMGRKGIVIGCLVLLCVWIIHIIYFTFGVKTIPTNQEAE